MSRMYNEIVIFYASTICCSSVVERKFTCVISEVWGKNILDFLCFIDSYMAFSTASWVDKSNEIENEMPDSYFLKI